jgi:hypothetical protein
MVWIAFALSALIRIYTDFQSYVSLNFFFLQAVATTLTGLFQKAAATKGDKVGVGSYVWHAYFYYARRAASYVLPVKTAIPFLVPKFIKFSLKKRWSFARSGLAPH